MFCGNCGKKLDDGVNFCPACGAPVHRAAASPEASVSAAPQPASVPQPAAAPQPTATTAAAITDKSVEQALLAGPIVLAFGVALVLLSGDMLSFLVDAAILGGAYFLGYRKFKEGKLKEAKTNSLVFGLVVAGFGILSAAQGNPLFLVIDAASAALLIYASTKL